MKYVNPYGTTDPDAPYINGDPSIGRQGSIPPAAAFEHPMRELVGVISNSQITPLETDLEQLTKAVRSQFLNYAADAGAANLLSVALDPPITAYTVGLPLRVRVLNTNTGPASIDAGGGRVNIRKPNGSAVAAGDLPAGGLIDLVYDGSVFQMINFGGTGTGGTINNYAINLPYVVDTSTTANVITAPFSPAITSMVAGNVILVKIANTNTGPTVINVNALAPITIKTQAGGDLLPQDILAGSVFVFIYDGTNFRVVPNNTMGGVTINVPSSQFNTPAAALTAIQRKTLTSLNVIKLATGIYDPFVISHPNAQYIQIQGTMIGPAPTMSNFAQSGNSASARASDAATNISMLRARYGSEIRVPAGFASIALYVTNTVGAAIVTDLLIAATTYQQAGNPGGIGISNMSINNVACWGLYGGFGANNISNVICINCWASGCNWGASAGEGGTLAFHGGGIFGCNFGINSSSCSNVSFANSYSRCNGIYGASAGASSSMGTTAVDVTNNGSIDVYASTGSYIGFNGAASTFSPALNTWGNYDSMIVAT